MECTVIFATAMSDELVVYWGLKDFCQVGCGFAGIFDLLWGSDLGV